MFTSVLFFQKSFLCLLGTIVLLSYDLLAQPVATTSRQIKESHYVLERYLPGEDIRQVYQDPRGVFWVLTEDGLYNFDGNHIYNIVKRGVTAATAVPKRISGSDAEDRVWLEYEEGGVRSWGAMNMITRQPIAEAALWAGVEDEVVEVLAEGEVLLLLTDTGTLLRFERGVWKPVTRGLPLKSRFVGSHSNRFVWLLTEPDAETEIPGIVRVVMPSGRQQRLNVDRPFVCRVAGPDLLLLSDQTWGLLNAYGEIRWLGLDKLIPGFDPGNDHWNANVEVALYGEVRDELWISHQNTLYIRGIRDSDKSPVIREEPLFAHRSLFAGLGGSVLLAEQSHLSHLMSYTGYFRKIGWHDPYRYSSEVLQPVGSVVETTQGKVYFGAGKGVYAWDRDSDNRELVLNTDRVSGMVWDADRQCVWGVAGRELFRLDVRTERAEVFALPGNGLEVKALLLQGEWLYLGGESGLVRFHTSEQVFYPFEAYNGHVELADAVVHGFFRVSGEEYWILSSKGIYGMDPERGILWQQHDTEDTEVNAAKASVRQVWKDTGEAYWMATAMGLLYWDKNRDTYQLFAEAAGLSGSDLRSVHVIGEELWLGSDRGLIVFDPKNQRSRYYTVADGLSDDHFLAGASAQGLDGTLYLGTRNGLTAFRPDALSASAGASVESPALSLMSALVYSPAAGNREALSQFYEQGRIVWEPEDVAMEIHFALPVLPGTKRVRLSYQVNEEEGWVPFTGYALRLSPASRQDTVIKIKARTQADAEEESVLQIPLRFEPADPFRPWLIALPVIVLLLSLLWYFNGLPRRFYGMPVAVTAVSSGAAPDPLEPGPPADSLRFFTGMAHELRAPLSLIVGPARYLRESGKLGKQEQALLETIQQNADYLLHQVDELLLLGALDAGKLPEKAGYFDPDAWFRERLHGFELLAQKKRIHISTHFGWNQPERLYHYKDWLTIIVNNLLSNAIKFTPNGGAIKLVMGVQGDHIRVVCQDTGRGIHPDDQPHIFERYFTSRRNDAPLESGTGIGLALVKELTDLMKGRLVMESTWGVGTEFTLDIPLIEAPDQGLGKRALDDRHVVSDPTKAALISGQVLLLVEDDPYFQDYIRVLLGRDYDVRMAANGKEALTLLRGGLQPALIVTDLMMPEMDGYQLLDELQAEEAWRQLPVVVLSVRRDATDEQRALAAGASGFFSKPLDERDLLYRLQRLLLANKAVEEQEKVVIIEENWERWLAQLTGFIESDMADDNFNVDTLAARMLMSRTAFYKKTQQLTGLTPNQYIMECRLQKAHRILENQPKTPIRKLVRMIGLKHEGYFTRHFTQRFGKSPTEFR